MKRKLLSLMITLSMVISLVGIMPEMTANAESAAKSSNSRNYYEYDGDEVWEYDDYDNVVYYYDGYGYWYEKTYEYYNGIMVWETYENSYGDYYECEYDYYSGVLVYEYNKDSDGYWYTYEYNLYGDQIYYWNSEGSEYETNWSYTYYSDGSIKTKYGVDSDDGFWQKYEYDSNGNPIYWGNSNGYWSKTTYTYYWNGKIESEYTEYSNGTWEKTTYDIYGYVISSTEGAITQQPTTSTPTTTTKKPTTTAAKPATTKKATTQKITKPAKVTKIKLKVKKKKLNVSWKKVSGATGYEIQVATNKKFTKNKKSADVLRKKVTIKLTSKKKYFVRVRAFKMVGNTKVYGSWTTKKIKIKK